MGWQDVIAIAIAIGAAIFVIRTLWRSLSGGGCHCAQAESASPQDSAPRASTPSLKRTPLVTIEQVGLPSSRRESA